MTTYRLFGTGSGGNGLNGPSSVGTYGGSIVVGTSFSATQGGCWLQGYWLWIPATGSSTAARKFALWSLYRTSGVNGVVIPAATVTSGTLTAGQWNFVALSSPVPLSPGGQTNGGANDGTGAYLAACGVNSGWAESNASTDAAHCWGTGGYTGGVVNGPLTGWSDVSGSGGTNPIPLAGGSFSQGVFTTGGSDPAVTMPGGGDNSGNFYLDVQVSDATPPGYTGSYRLWPNQPFAGGSNDATGDTGEQTTGTAFTLSQACTLNNIWHYSSAGVGTLPQRCQIWNTATGTLVAGTDVAASWSGAAASGWVANPYTGITLAAGSYIVTVYHTSDGLTFYHETRGYFGTYLSVPGPAAASGIVTGPLTAPDNAASITAIGFGNSNYFTGGASPTYPDAYDTADGGENRWVDVEVTPVAAGAAVPAPQLAVTRTEVIGGGRGSVSRAVRM